MVSHETQTSERPDLGIERVDPGLSINATREDFPWLSSDLEIPTALVTLETGEVFHYGSLVQGNNTLVKVAKTVPSQSSHNAELGLFKALPTLLHGGDHPSIDTIAGTQGPHSVYKVAKRGNDVARLAFIRTEGSDGHPVILKLGIAPHKKQSAMVGVLTGGRKAGKKYDA